MKKVAVLLLLATGPLAAGCSPLMYPGLLPPARAFAPPAAMAPLPFGRWDSVMRLPAGSTIDVLTMDGRATVGAIAGADGTEVTVEGDGGPVRIQRADIVRIDLVDLAGSEVKAIAGQTAKGAAIGAGAAALVGAVVGGGLWPPPAELVRLGVAAGGVAGVQAGLRARQRRIIYLAPDRLAPGVANPAPADVPAAQGHAGRSSKVRPPSIPPIRRILPPRR
jgi:hypothetical protein